MENQSTDNLLPIRVAGEVLTVSSLDFAAGLGIQHKNLMEAVRTHQEAIENGFGIVTFETEKSNPTSAGRPQTVAYLTEEQALFVGTLSRNSKRVVEFKATLVRSFMEARKRLLAEQPAPAPVQLPTEQVLVQLMAQSNQLLANQQAQLDQLRADVNHIRSTGHRPPTPARHGRQLRVPGTPAPSPAFMPGIRQSLTRRVSEYSGHYAATTQDTWNYLYKRFFEVNGVAVYRLMRVGNESLLDVVERYGYLDQLYRLAVNELPYPDE